MPSLRFALALILCVLFFPLAHHESRADVSRHYIFAWTGDAAHKSNDFLAIIDGDPASPSYGSLAATLVTDQQTMLVHHTEYVMPASAKLFANDHEAGRTFIFDVRDALHPKIVTSFDDMGGYMHPHSYVRMPNGHILATFQRTHHGASHDMSMSSLTGGLVEIDDEGKLIRAVSNADPAFPNERMTPYSLVVQPEIDRVVSTNSSMEDADLYTETTFQVWRLSDLRLLKTVSFDPGREGYAQFDPEEPRVGPDGSIFVQTLACGVERISGADTDDPKSQLVWTFPGAFCGVPTIVGHFLIDSVPVTHGLIALDISNPAKPMEVGRLRVTEKVFIHWTSWDTKTLRLAVTGGDSRLYLVKLDQTTGALSIDDAFHDSDGKPGFNFANRQWPHGWTGTGMPHGVVFSR
jgi:hypothetical protein